MEKNNSFNDKTKIGIITAVHPDAKTIDIDYISQSGSFKGLQLPYTIVGSTYGLIFCPLKGDKVIIDDNSNGQRPTVKTMYASSVDLLPYTYPGEMAITSEGGSYIQWKAQRKRSISSGKLLDYDATVGSNNEANDIQYEPSGLVMQVRSKQDRNQLAPRYNLHSHFSMFDNGDVSIQSQISGVPKGLLHFNSSGLVFLGDGDTNGATISYLEFNPLTMESLLHTSKNQNSFSGGDKKTTVYKNKVENIGGGWQIVLGQALNSIPGNFNDVSGNNITGVGDIYISNQNTIGTGITTIHTKGNFNIISDTGDLDVTVSQGNTNINVTQGKVNVTSKSDVNVNTEGNTNITTTGITNVNSTGAMNLTSNAVVTIGGSGGVILNGNGSIQLGTGASDSVVLKSTFDAHEHIYQDNGPQITSPPTVPSLPNGIFG